MAVHLHNEERAGVLSLAEVLRVPTVRNAGPEVLAGAGNLNRPVRWVHTTELADIGPLLRGGDLVLTTGIALPESAAGLQRFARSLVESEAAGLVIELGRRWTEVPASLVAECERLDLPLVAMHREVKFAALTQAVGERLVDEQLAELREAQRVHDTFTELSIAEAGPATILDAIQRLAGGAVVLENGQHQVLDFRGGAHDVATFLEDWEPRSRRIEQDVRTVWDESNGWLITRVGRRERDWGRLVIEAPVPPSQRLIAVGERAAATLAMHRLHDRTRDNQVRRLHQELLLGLQTDPSSTELMRRVEVAGIPTTTGSYVGLSLRPERDSTAAPGRLAAQLDELVVACLRAAEILRRPTLVAAFESDVRVLLSVPTRTDPDRAVDRLVQLIGERVQVVAAQGSAVKSLGAADRTLREAIHVLGSVRRTPTGVGVHRLRDLHIRGLVALLADDDRLQAFADRELSGLCSLRDEQSEDLRRTLRTVLEHWDNKSEAAQRLNLSRPVLYARIHALTRVLGTDLSDPEARTSLHVALIFEEVQGPGGHGPEGQR